jgi:hypothetical protein
MNFRLEQTVPAARLSQPPIAPIESSSSVQSPRLAFWRSHSAGRSKGFSLATSSSDLFRLVQFIRLSGSVLFGSLRNLFF